MMNSQKAIKYRFLSEPQAVIPAKAGIQSFLGVHGFKGSGVQGSILIPGLHLGEFINNKHGNIFCNLNWMTGVANFLE